MFKTVIIIVLILYAMIYIYSFLDNKLPNNSLRVLALKTERPLKSIIFKLLVLLFVLNSIDAVSTWYAISTGIASEQNGAMAWLISNGLVAFFVFKLGILSAVVIDLYFLYIKEKNIFRIKKIQKKRNPIVSIMCVTLFVGLYWWVCLNNVGIILMAM